MKTTSEGLFAEVRNVPGQLYLNADVVDEARQLSGAGGNGTVDELGFQQLYDSIATTLFPWCSTLTTRARYFFFSVAVLDFALKSSVDAKHIDANLEMAEALTRVKERQNAFTRALQQAEKALALTLVAKYPEGSEGVFGSVRCRRLFQSKQLVSGYREKILSADGRYPNAIYRGACRNLGMFSAESSLNSGLIEARVLAREHFAENWLDHARLTRALVEELASFWKDMESEGVPFDVARNKLAECSVFTNFHGFTMSREEARFLYGQIRSSSPYLDGVSPKLLASLVKQGKDGEIDLLQVGKFVTDANLREIFTAGHHIDEVTRYFRGLYQALSRDSRKAERTKLPLGRIKQSLAWLDDHHQDFPEGNPWGAIWHPEMSGLISRWTAAAAPDGTPGDVLDMLRERAEEVVSGRGKEAPHKKRRSKSEDENDLRSELEVRETSFRLWNATRILRDIAKSFDA